jgi:hypothetical protein
MSLQFRFHKVGTQKVYFHRSAYHGYHWARQKCGLTGSSVLESLVYAKSPCLHMIRCCFRSIWIRGDDTRQQRCLLFNCQFGDQCLNVEVAFDQALRDLPTTRCQLVVDGSRHLSLEARRVRKIGSPKDGVRVGHLNVLHTLSTMPMPMVIIEKPMLISG